MKIERHETFIFQYISNKTIKGYYKESWPLLSTPYSASCIWAILFLGGYFKLML